MNFDLHMPTEIFFGEGKIEKLGKQVKQYGNKILLLYGKGSIKRSGVYDAVIDQLKQHDIEYVELSGVDPNPRVTTVREGSKLCKERGIDFILAVGGGSTIDCAKGIAIAAKYDGDPWDFYAYIAQPTDGLPLGTVLTLSATGSEMNAGSVITNEETKQKHGYGCEYMMPKFSVLDPTYTYTVSKHQTACGVVDILTHIYEFYFTMPVAQITDGISESLMRTVIEFGSKAYEQPEDYEARANIMWASSMALNGITTLGKVFDGFNHGVEHSLSAVYDITHADGLAILAPHWMTYILDETTAPKLATFARNVWGIEGEDDMAAAQAGIEAVTAFYKSLDMPLKLSDVGIDDSQLDAFVEKSVFGETIGEFVKLSKEDVKEILKSAL